MVVGVIILGVVGIVLVILGHLLWKKEKISLLHSYHYDKVLEEDKKAFCTLSGLGVLMVGVGILTTGLIMGFTDSAWSFIEFAIGFVAGIALLIYAGIRYNWYRN